MAQNQFGRKESPLVIKRTRQKDWLQSEELRQEMFLQSQDEYAKGRIPLTC